MLFHANFAARTNQAFPFVWLLRDLAGKQDLDSSLEKLPRRRVLRAYRLCPNPTSGTVKSGRKDPCIVEYNQVIRAQEIGKVTKPAILKHTRGTVYPE
jgi:hypothetical protein